MGTSYFSTRLILGLFALCVLVFSGCGTGPEIKPVYFLFEKSYSNFAWRPSYHGISIDSEGNVWRFIWQDQALKDWVQEEENRHWDALSQTTLTKRYAPERTLVRTLAKSEVIRMAELIQPAAEGEVVEADGTTRDFGISGSYAFLYDPQTQTYRQVTLENGGDWTSENTAPEAKELAAWLQEIEW